ncbi:MAG: hypothetical protein HYU66_08585 [Armatimonadetes bacterium]|nr:hypothetical protein [Armatimonadota bacterium]
MRPDVPAASDPAIPALRAAILSSPLTVALHRAETYTRVFQDNEGAPWVVLKALAFREHLRTVPLLVRPGDRLAGSLCEIPGGMPLFVELGIAENGIFVAEDPHRRGYLRGQVPKDIREWWEERNLWGRHRAWLRTVHDWTPERGEVTQYKFLSCQGHLSPSYRELLRVGLGGLREQVRRRRAGETDPESLEFLTAAALGLEGVSDWISRYAALSPELGWLARLAAEPPATFREALQLVWFCHQAIHIEGHGYSNTPDRLDQILAPFYEADLAAGRITPGEALTLCENLLLKLRDNTVWSVEHNLTQGVCLGGSAADGADQTTPLSWLFLEAADRLALPEPLVWVRWHPNLDPAFFEFCLEKLAGRTCFPLFMSDTAVPAMFMSLGVSRDDAFDYVPVGCNELAIPGKAYFNPCAHVDYLTALRGAMSAPDSPPTFDALTESIGGLLRGQVERSYAHGMLELDAQRKRGQTPFTSCFFDGCIARGRDMTAGTRYNVLSCGGTSFANFVDCLAALREVVYERGEATLAEVTAACEADFVGHEALRAKLLAAPKQGRDDPRVAELVTLAERLRDEPVKAICRDPRDGTPFGNCHVVRSGAVLGGRHTPATPDGRKAGTPLASSVAAACGNEIAGPTALLNSVLHLHPATSWQCGYNVNLRLQPRTLREPESRAKVRAMLEAFFSVGGQELQINAVDSATLRAAQGNPASFGDLVVRVAGFSEFFVKLDPAIQEDIIAREEHA